MRYGFIIDNRKCIGCHACTTACKSEHDTPIGVNRTWVKQVEKGNFPDTRRLFSVMRCNHCTDAPCVEICPTEALFFRDDGIVDFDKERCIGCKSCMQACPYDALYIDPETHTAAKCNYCAHRIDLGLEPACVNVCPEHAIISGDMDNPHTEISQLLARQAVKVRKPEKATIPNLFYIDGDDASLVPAETEKSNSSLWGSQSRGVGHYAREAEKMAYTNGDVVAEVLQSSYALSAKKKPPRSVEVLMNKVARSVYETPDKGILWGWEVSVYIWTKAIAAGVLLAPLIGWIMGKSILPDAIIWTTVLAGLLFLSLTGLFLIMDLDQPKRFFYVLLRPHFGSWLVKGGYTLTLFGGLLAALGLSQWMAWPLIKDIVLWISLPVAILLATYTAFLFAQARGRDFWQSPTLALHMLVHAVMAGAAFFLMSSTVIAIEVSWFALFKNILIAGLVINLITLTVEFVTPHPTQDSKATAWSIVFGRYSRQFWVGVIMIGNIIPLFLVIFAGFSGLVSGLAGILVLLGLYITEYIWVDAPQRIPLT